MEMQIRRVVDRTPARPLFESSDLYEILRTFRSGMFRSKRCLKALIVSGYIEILDRPEFFFFKADLVPLKLEIHRLKVFPSGTG